jgi:two-component system, NarL family, sensor kinase
MEPGAARLLLASNRVLRDTWVPAAYSARMGGTSHARGAFTRALTIGLLAVATAELATAIAVALATNISWADAVDSFTVTNGAMAVGFAACGGLLAWHRPANPIGWLFLAAGVAEATSAGAIQLVILLAERGWHGAALGVLASLFNLGWPLAIGPCLLMSLLLFPEGRPVSSRWRWTIWAAAVVGVLFELSLAGPGTAQIGHTRVSPDLTVPFYNRLTALWTASNIAYAAIEALALGSLVLRYRRGDDTARRQLLWLLLACVAVFGYAGLWWGIVRTGPILGLLVIPLIPAAITVAILKYQLLDIRLVFSRTLAYAIVTGLLVGVYAGLILLITQVFGFHSPVAVAAATLAAAALFNPLRRRVQLRVDRRFNRARYDADRAITAFAARVRNAVDLDAISADLTAAVQTALEPAHLTVLISRGSHADADPAQVASAAP